MLLRTAPNTSGLLATAEPQASCRPGGGRAPTSGDPHSLTCGTGVEQGPSASPRPDLARSPFHPTTPPPSEEVGTWDARPVFLPGSPVSSTFAPDVPGRRSRTWHQPWADTACAPGGRSKTLQHCTSQDADLQLQCPGRIPPPFSASLVPLPLARPLSPSGSAAVLRVPRSPLSEELWPALLRHPERDANEGAWPGAASQPAPGLRLAEAGRKDDVMQRRGGVTRRGPRLLPLGLVCLCLALGRVKLDSIGKACKSLLF